jgi:hypothetical protein
LGGLQLAASPNEAALWLHPHLLRGPAPLLPQLRQLNAAARRRRQPLLVLVLHDETMPYTGCEWLMILRTSLDSRQRLPNEWVLPYSWESRHEPWVAAPAAAQPGISFCGLASHWRQPLLDAFSAATDITADFILREQFWGGKPQDPVLQADFWQNMMAHPFALAPRGEGNFSMRLYQALSVGRIPVLLHTANSWPLASLLPWHQMVIEAGTPGEAVAQVRRCWETGEVLQRQQRCYELYHQYLSVDRFLQHQLPAMMASWQPPRRWWPW